MKSAGNAGHSTKSGNNAGQAAGYRYASFTLKFSAALPLTGDKLSSAATAAIWSGWLGRKMAKTGAQ